MLLYTRRGGNTIWECLERIALLHFVDVNKMVLTGNNTERYVQDVKLTKYACYLIAMNGDPRKEIIALAQTYFVVKTKLGVKGFA